MPLEGVGDQTATCSKKRMRMVAHLAADGAARGAQGVVSEVPVTSPAPLAQAMAVWAYPAMSPGVGVAGEVGGGADVIAGKLGVPVEDGRHLLAGHRAVGGEGGVTGAGDDAVGPGPVHP